MPSQVNAAEALIAQIYGGVLDEAAWSSALVSLADRVRGSGALLFAMNPLTGAIYRDEIHRFDPRIVADYRAHWCLQDVRLVPGSRMAIGVPQYEQAMFGSLRDWERSEIYNEFLRPHDAPYFLAHWLQKDASQVVALSIEATRGRGAFTPSDGASLSPFIPHVRRAFEIRARLQETDLQLHALRSAADRLPYGVLLLDDSGRLLEANGRAEQNLGPGQFLELDSSRRLDAAGKAGEALRRWWTHGAPPGTLGAENGLIQVPRCSRPPLSLLVVKLATPTPGFENRGAAWLVLVFDPDDRREPLREWIIQRFGVSAREAELLCALAAGQELGVAATSLGIRPGTAAAHLKSVFRKTGVHRRADLIRLAAAGPLAD
jgi:DNA-binding CsgD family transcriptional regulator/PAS domain-containing protein